VERPRRGGPREIFSIVEMVSIDEAYLDLAGTERLQGPPLAAADKLLSYNHANDVASLFRRTCRDAPGR